MHSKNYDNCPITGTAGNKPTYIPYTQVNALLCFTKVFFQTGKGLKYFLNDPTSFFFSELTLKNWSLKFFFLPIRMRNEHQWLSTPWKSMALDSTLIIGRYSIESGNMYGILEFFARKRLWKSGLVR
jgi:hypothetical protein